MPSTHAGRAAAVAAVAALAVAACGGGSTAHSAANKTTSSAGTTASAAAAKTTATVCRPPAPANLAAPGPFAVRRAHTRLTRPRSTASGTRSIDPTVWYPVPPSGAAGRGCRFPLILFSHGVASSPDNYSTLLSHLASEGFVVLGPQHSGGPGDEATERVDDLVYLLAHLTAVAQKLAPGLAARIDSSRIGVAGHSFGAFTAARLAAQEPRVKAAMIMAGGSDPSSAMQIRAATLAMAGAQDNLIPLPRVRSFEQALPATTPHGLMIIARAGHTSFSNKCVPSGTCAINERTGAALFLTYLDGLPGASAPIDPAHVNDPRVTLTTVGMPPR